MNKLTIVGWIPYEETAGMPEAVDGCGGWFSEGHRWADYLAHVDATAHPYAEAIRAHVLETRSRMTGQEHQYNSGVPVFSDGKVATYTYRGWGDLMAAIWATEEDKDYHYMDFYM